MFSKGDKVRLGADWFALHTGCEGEVLGDAFDSRGLCLVRFRGGTHLIPAILLERVRRADELASAA